MKTIIQIVGMLLLTSCAWAEDYSGNWTGQVNQQAVYAQLNNTNQHLRGRLEMQGYIYQLSCKASADSDNTDFTGVLMDQAGMQAPIDINAKDASHLSVKVYLNGKQLDPIDFELALQNKLSNTQEPQPDSQLDNNLLGTWVYSESYTSDGFGAAYQEKVTFYPNGQLQYGDNAIGAGTGDVHVINNGSDNLSNTLWKVHQLANGDRHLYVQENGRWLVYGRYYIENGRMLITKADGSKEFWQR